VDAEGLNDRAERLGHLADHRAAVHRGYLIDNVPVPGEDARDEAVGDALDEVPADLATQEGARLVGLDSESNCCGAEVSRPGGRVQRPWPGQSLTWKSPSVNTCAPKAREIASRSPLIPSGITTSIR
jgi:hypothetical protein